MPFLPVVQRELIQASRRRSTHGTRLWTALAGLIIGGWVMLFPELSTPRMLGISLFVPLSSLTCLYCLFIGIFRTADCLSEEKREGTLGLLFLTDLRGYDVVLGKLAATSLNAFYGVLALFPVLAIPLLVGGVTVQEFGRVTMVALNTLFFSLAVGMFCSCFSQDERRPMLAALLVILVLAAGLPILAGVLMDHKSTQAWGPYLFIPSPGYAAFMAFEATFRRGAIPFNFFYHSLLFTHLLSWVLLLGSCFIVPRTWQDRPQHPASIRRHAWLARLQFGSSRSRSEFRRRLLEVNPLYWLAARHRSKPFLVWATLAVSSAIWGLGLAFDPLGWTVRGSFLITALLSHTILKFWVATEAARQFSPDRQSGALELLLSTPLSVPEIVRGKMLGLERQFAAPAIALAVAEVINLMSGHRDSEERLVLGVLPGIFLVDMVCLSWVGMWRGLNSRRPNHAAAAALGQVLVLPWVVFGLLLTGAATASRSSGFQLFRWILEHGVFLGLGIELAVVLAFALPARRRLLSLMRTVAAQPFDRRGHAKD